MSSAELSWQQSLSERGLEWVKASLSRGHALSRAVLEVVDFRWGATTAIIPSEFENEVLYAFDQSAGITASDADAGLEVLLSALPSDGTLVVEDELAKAGDGFLARARSNFSVYGDEVLWSLDWPRSSAAGGIRRHSSGYPTNAFLVVFSDGIPSVLDENSIMRMARTTVGVICSAYDAESFVVWTRN
jgi:hypothetical protein